MFFGTSPLHAPPHKPLPHKGAPCGRGPLGGASCGPQAPQVTDPNASNMFFGTSRRLMAEDNDDC